MIRRALFALLAASVIAGAVWGMIAFRRLRARVAGDLDAAVTADSGDPSALAAMAPPPLADAGDDDAGDDEELDDDDNPYADVDAMAMPKPATSVAIRPMPTIKKPIVKGTTRGTKKKKR